MRPVKKVRKSEIDIVTVKDRELSDYTYLPPMTRGRWIFKESFDGMYYKNGRYDHWDYLTQERIKTSDHYEIMEDGLLYERPHVRLANIRWGTIDTVYFNTLGEAIVYAEDNFNKEFITIIK